MSYFDLSKETSKMENKNYNKKRTEEELVMQNLIIYVLVISYCTLHKQIHTLSYNLGGKKKPNMVDNVRLYLDIIFPHL